MPDPYMLSRMDGESDLAYHRRLVYGKMVNKTLTDVDYSELAPLIYGKELSSDSTRKALYGSVMTLEAMDRSIDQLPVCESAQYDGEDEADSAVTAEIDRLQQERYALQKERQRFFDQRTELNKMLRERARQEELNDIIRREIESGTLPRLDNYSTEERIGYRQSGKDLLVSLNDIHYGAVVDNYWSQYNPDMCARMLADYVIDILSIADTHKCENVYIWANGDLISGAIHHQIAVSNKENVIKQVMGVSELIACFISKLAPHFNKVGYVSVAGNHSRLVPNKDNALFDERLDDIVEWYLKARLQNIDNVMIGCGESIDPTMYVLNVRGKNYVGCHGDYDPTPSHVQSLQTMVGRPVYAVLLGHKHHNATGVVQGVRTIMAGSFQGMDTYCVQKRIYGVPEQMACVVDEDGVVCTYGIEL